MLRRRRPLFFSSSPSYLGVPSSSSSSSSRVEESPRHLVRVVLDIHNDLRVVVGEDLFVQRKRERKVQPTCLCLGIRGLWLFEKISTFCVPSRRERGKEIFLERYFLGLYVKRWKVFPRVFQALYSKCILKYLVLVWSDHHHLVPPSSHLVSKGPGN